MGSQLLEERFWSKVDRTETCWLWMGAASKGYGLFTFNKVTRKAHRIAYELVIGPIPEGLTLDHLCRVRNCVNPAHLEPCTQVENLLRSDGPTARNARRTHCADGHPLDGVDSRPSRVGRRYCTLCKRRKRREAKLRRRRAGVAHDSA